MGVFQSQKTVPVQVADLASVAQTVASHFQAKGFEVKTQSTDKGWHISISKADVFKTVMGTKTALNVELEPKGDNTDVSAGIGVFGQHGAGGLGSILAGPLMLTQLWGMVQQSKLDDEAIAVAEKALQDTKSAAAAEKAAAERAAAERAAAEKAAAERAAAERAAAERAAAEKAAAERAAAEKAAAERAAAAKLAAEMEARRREAESEAEAEAAAQRAAAAKAAAEKAAAEMDARRRSAQAEADAEAAAQRAAAEEAATDAAMRAAAQRKAAEEAAAGQTAAEKAKADAAAQAREALGAEPKPAETRGVLGGSERIYVVVAGDSLYKIAERFYGNGNRWPELFEANKAIIKNPRVIRPGQKLRIP